MKIRSKLLMALLGVSLIPLTALSLFSIYSAQKRMETHVGDRYLNLARTKALSLEMTIDERLEQAEGLSLTPFIITSVEKSNASYLNKSDDDIQKEIHQLDREWIASSGKTAAADRIKNSPLSVFLRALQDKAPERYGEIFITDQRGAVIAMTAPLTDYNQADELWWRHSFDQGRGRPFIDNRGYDKSVGAVVFGIALPIEKNGAVIGILKVNYRMSEVLSALAPEKLDVSGSIFLADSLGHFILSKGGVERAALNEKEQAIVKSSGTGWTEDLHNGTATIMAYHPVKTEIFTRIAKSSATMDIAGEQWVPSHWTVFFEIDRAVAFSLIRNITNLFWVVGLFVLVSSVLLAKLLARRISAPLEMLIKGVKDVGAGQHAEAVQVTSRDEISQLANAFNDMTRRLREVTVSRDALNQEIQARQKLENALRDSNARLNAIFEDASDAIILADIRTGRFATFNKRAHQVFGYDAEEFSRLRLSDLGLEDIHYTPESTTEEAPAKAAFILPQKCRVKAGVLRDFLITSRLISINGNRYSLKIMQDVTEQQEARAFQRLSDAVFDIATEGIVITDARANVITVNPAFTAITGYTAKEIFGKNPRILQSGRHDKKFYKTMWDAIHQQGYWSGEIWNRRKNGEIYPEWLSITAIKDEMGNLIQYTGLFSDITRQKKDEHELLFQAHHDALTGLPNRTLCIERLAQAVKLSRRNHKKTALLFIDLNGFKQVNDTYGHLSGDKALQEIARRLLSIVRLTDTVTRPGGDEFIIILTDLSDSQEAVTLARKIIKEISKPVQLNGQHSYLGASIGISIAPDDATAPLSIIQKADMAMYKAKGLGPNHIQFFSDELGKLAAKNALMEWDLKRAIKQIDIEFTLHYQPVFDLNTRQMSSCEALIRWHHPEKGVILPDAFIPVSEKSGLTSKISPWVLSTACTKLKEWHDRFGLNLAGSVNLSSKDLSHADPLPWIIDALEKSGLPPHLLIVEITERTMINPQDAEILRKLKKISDFGIRISVDDFGTGYSSLSYLAKYPIDILKIDKSFTLNIASDPEKQPIVEAITQMGKKLKMEIIAEGVETRRDCAYLTDIGCDKAQGYYFDQPCSGKDFEKKLEVSQVET